MTYDWRYWLAGVAAARGAEGPAARRRLANSAGVTSSGFSFVVFFFPLPFPAAADCFAITVVIAERLPILFPEARGSSSVVATLVDVESMVGAGVVIVTFLRFSGDARGLVLCFAPFCEDRGRSVDSRNPFL
jgi:hypothetical protein